MDAKSDITEVEAFMREYNDLFSSGDAKALWSRVYRFEPGSKTMINSEADLKKLHDDIVAKNFPTAGGSPRHGCPRSIEIALKAS